MIKILKENFFFDTLKLDHSFRPSHSAILLICQGSLVLESNGVDNVYEKNNILLTSPKSIYTLKGYSDNLKVYILRIDMNSLRSKITLNLSLTDLYQLTYSSKRGMIISANETEFNQLIQLSQILENYLQTSESLFFQQEIIIHLISTIIYKTTGIIINKRTSVKQAKNRKEEITLNFFRLADEFYKEHKDLSFYASRLSISIKYLSICVKDVTKTAPSTLLAVLLLNESKVLLLNTKKTISLIAQILGFSDQYAFGKFFKKHTGISPKNYRIENHLVDLS